MLNRCLTSPLWAVVLTGTMIGSSAGQPPDPDQASTGRRIPPKDRPLEYWIDQLSHDQFYRREVATRQLAAAGPAAVPILQQSISSGDLEATERAIQVLGKIALDQSPDDETGAWGALNELVAVGTGSRRARAQHVIDQIWQVREKRAVKVLGEAGVFIGVDDFAVGSLTSQVLMVRIDDEWTGDKEALGWLRWLRQIEHASISGKSIQPNVVESIISMPDVSTIALVDGELNLASLQPLKSMTKLNSLEVRYIRLSPELVDAIADLPIRESLNLMGTALREERVELLRKLLPGLAITFRQGGFLGVTCNTIGVAECRIRNVIPESAADQAGLLANDVIIAIDNASVEEFSDLQEEINKHLPGDEISIKYTRQGDQREVKLSLGKYRNQ